MEFRESPSMLFWLYLIVFLIKHVFCFDAKHSDRRESDVLYNWHVIYKIFIRRNICLDTLFFIYFHVNTKTNCRNEQYQCTLPKAIYCATGEECLFPSQNLCWEPALINNLLLLCLKGLFSTVFKMKLQLIFHLKYFYGKLVNNIIPINYSYILYCCNIFVVSALC